MSHSVKGVTATNRSVGTAMDLPALLSVISCHKECLSLILELEKVGDLTEICLPDRIA